AMGQLMAKASDRSCEPQLLQLRRMELMRELVDRRRQLPDLAQQLLHPRAEVACRLGGLLAQQIHFNGQQGHPLAGVVVQLTGNPPRFTFLGLEQPAGQTPELDLAQPQFLLRLPPMRHLNEQSHDECRLEDEETDRANDLPVVELPESRLSIPHS